MTIGSGGFWQVFQAITAPMPPRSSSASAMNFPLPLGTPCGRPHRRGRCFRSHLGGDLTDTSCGRESGETAAEYTGLSHRTKHVDASRRSAPFFARHGSGAR